MTNPSPRPAFDALAPTYDADFTHSVIARHLRERTHARLLEALQSGDAVLELGCGTGEDARFLGERAFTVTATDASPLMLDTARAKCAKLQNVAFKQLDLNQLDTHSPTASSIKPGEAEHALAFANFGVLNCIRDLPTFAEWLADQIRPGGTACFAVMAPLCLWEIGWHGLHGNLRTALRRVRSDTTFQPPTATPPGISRTETAARNDSAAESFAPIPLRYPSVRTLTTAFAPHFQRIQVEPLGIFLPPSDVYGAIERRPALLRTLLKLDSMTERASWLANLADHYWITFKR